MKHPFGGDDPNVIFQTIDFFPVEGMTHIQKLNAISRGVIILCIIGFILTQSVRVLFVSGLTLVSIYLYHLNKKRENQNETFENPADQVLKDASVLRDVNVFDTPDSSNPFGNVLVTDYKYNPNKNPRHPLSMKK